MTMAHGEDDFDLMAQRQRTRRVSMPGKPKGPRPRKSASEVDFAENGLFGTGLRIPPILRRRAGLLMGLAIVSVVAATVVSLATWSVSDPSLSHATDVTPQNRLGYPGAVLADLAMQLTGFGSIALLFLLCLWGWQMATGRSRRIRQTKIGAWLLGTAALCGMIAVFPVVDGWPLPVGMGGYVGDMAIKPMEALWGADLGLAGRIATCIVYACVGTLLFRYAAPADPARPAKSAKRGPADYADFDEDEDDDDDALRDGPFVTIAGWFAHWGLMLQMRARRMMTKRDNRAGSPSFIAKLSQNLRREPDDGLEAFLSPRERDEMERERLARATAEADGGRPISVQRLRDATQPEGAFDGYEDAEQDDGADAEPDPRFRSQFRDRPADEPAAELDDFEPEIEDGDPWDGFDRAIQTVTETELARGVPVDGTLPPPPPRWRDDAPSEDELLRPISVAKPAPAPKPGKRIVRDAQPSFLAPEDYELPPLTLLAEPQAAKQSRELSDEVLTDNARMLEGVLEDFGVRGEIINVRPGPVVTLYELEPAPGIKSSRVIGLADDIARSMSAISARVAVIPGKNAIGIELPNSQRETVYLRELVAAESFEKSKAKLALCLGKTIGGEPVIADLARMPHLLVAGTTGSGKSVSINTMILSLLYRHKPERCKLIMIDPKMLELSVYDGIPHLLTPVVTDPAKAVMSLKWTVREMEDRYRQMSKLGVRNIDGFNTRINQALAKGEQISRTVQTGFDPETGEAIFEEETLDLKPMPYIVVIVDEMADLMMVAGKDIEGAIQRLAQMARAAGIHLIMATQRPSVDVITGTIKANFPTRISFQVTSKIDSRTILGEQGAEQLLGMGDMLYMAGGGRIQRVHGPFVTDDEVEDIVAHLKTQGAPAYLEGITDDDEMDFEAAAESPSGGGQGNELYDQAVAIVLRDKKASTSYIQRRLSIGYNRAATLIERMEQEGVISAANHAGKREILVGDGVD